MTYAYKCALIGGMIGGGYAEYDRRQHKSGNPMGMDLSGMNVIFLTCLGVVGGLCVGAALDVCTYIAS